MRKLRPRSIGAPADSSDYSGFRCRNCNRSAAGDHAYMPIGPTKWCAVCDHEEVVRLSVNRCEACIAEEAEHTFVLAVDVD